MCRHCDALAPICGVCADPNWLFAVRPRVRFRPPAPDDLLSQATRQNGFQDGDFVRTDQPCDGLRNGAVRRDLAFDAGSLRPGPAFRPVLADW